MVTRGRRIRGFRQGFTLIELMVVIAIIGILAAILTPILLRARLKSYHVACCQNERNIATALEAYVVDSRGTYPEKLEDLVQGSKPYLQSLPKCPSNATGYEATYTPSDDHKEYVLTCPGIHAQQLEGIVEPGYPQVINGQLYANHGPEPSTP